jgi:hypothetical protein
MQTPARLLVPLALGVGFVALGFLIAQVDDKKAILLLALSVVTVYWLCRWEIDALRKQVDRLEGQIADLRREREGPTGGLSDLGDLKHPSPEQVARTLGRSVQP